MGRQLMSHGPLDLGPLFGGHPPAVHQQFGKRHSRLVDPACTRLRQVIAVDRPTLKSDNAKEEITLGVHDCLTFPSTLAESVDGSDSMAT